MPVVIHTDWYMQVAGAAGRASWDIQQAITTADATLQDCTGMAGDDEIGTSWGQAYDKAIKPIVDNTCQLSTALSSFGARVNQAGHNHDVAESVAGRASSVRSTKNQYDFVTNVRLSSPGTAIGPSSEDGGVGESLAGMLIKEQLSSKIPNAKTDRVTAAAQALTRLASSIGSAIDGVAHAVNSDSGGDAEDVKALRAELSSNIFAAAEAIQSDTASLASSAEKFASDVEAKRAEMKAEADGAQRDIGTSAGLAIAGTILTGGLAAPGTTAAEVAAVTARIALAARRIYALIKAVEALTSLSNITALTPQSTASTTSKLQASINHPSADIEVDENGVIKRTPLFPPLKQKAWEEYLRNGGDHDIERWSREYDQLLTNASNGNAWDQAVKDIKGYTPESGWQPQYANDEVAEGRRWDFANERLREAVENKSGRLDPGQLVGDREALEKGWRVTYNLQSDLSPADVARLETLKAEFPDLFTYQWPAR